MNEYDLKSNIAVLIERSNRHEQDFEEIKDSMKSIQADVRGLHEFKWQAVGAGTLFGAFFAYFIDRFWKS